MYGDSAADAVDQIGQSLRGAGRCRGHTSSVHRLHSYV
jgi:hypothetical protein